MQLFTAVRPVIHSKRYLNRLFSTMSVTYSKQGREKRDVPPPVHRGMIELDRSKFHRTVQCTGARVEGSAAGPLSKDKVVQAQLLCIPRIRTVVADPETPGGRLLLLGVPSEAGVSEPVRAALDGKVKGFIPYKIELDYDHWGATDILHAVLPEELLDDAPAAFTHTGHIGHLNLRDEFLPYRYLIGQVILDKNRQLRTVVNKLDSIDSEFRVFKMEVIAGDKDLVTTAHESGCRFTFDFSTVYWNSRLQTEHERLVQQWFEPGQVIADVMAGVGPFAVPAAKKGCFVMGNDLNPESAHWMERNRVDNKVTEALRVSNIDGREFIRTAPLQAWTAPFPPLPEPPAIKRKKDKEARKAREAAALAKKEEQDNVDDPPTTDMKNLSIAPVQSPETIKLQPQMVDHFVMNLPASALEFLDAYNGCYKPLLEQPGFPGVDKAKMPLIHTHCFTREVEESAAAEADICKRASGYLDYPVHPTMDGYHLHLVRSVAPNKDMYCLTFRLPRQVAFR